VLREIAELTAESPDVVVRRAIEELVADYIDGRIAMQRLADPSDAVISSEEMWCNLEERENVDVAPEPAGILALTLATLAEVPAAERDLLTRKLSERER